MTEDHCSTYYYTGAIYTFIYYYIPTRQVYLHFFFLFVLTCFFLCSAGTNVAVHKPTNQSTTARGGSSSNANNGDPTSVHDGRRCTETLKEPSPWWSVDLLQPYPVRAVSITTRGCCGKFVHRNRFHFAKHWEFGGRVRSRVIKLVRPPPAPTNSKAF